MKQQINRNILWCRVFVKLLSDAGIKNVCISPGSRSTPLTLAFSMSKNFNVYPIVDERSSAYFALGLAKKTNTPTVIVTTSGTAVAEVYPAIIEAYYQRIPLIVCTADRPAYLRNRGANQTINQHNIYKNHIKFYYDTGLPVTKITGFDRLVKNTLAGLDVAIKHNPGPIHFNLPFEKPFEPDTFTDSIETKFIERLLNIKREISKEIVTQQTLKPELNKLTETVKKKRKGIIICGYNNYGVEFKDALINFSEQTGYPIFADGASGLRYGITKSKNVIDNFNTLIRSDLFCKKFDPEIIILLGGAPTSNQLHDFIKKSNAEKIIVNEFGDKNDPTLTAKKVIKINPIHFFRNSCLDDIKLDKVWINTFVQLNKIVSDLKISFIDKKNFTFESKVVNDLIEFLPNNCNLMVSNSLPIRDIDFFSACSSKKINVFTNRGASGIDGINSTALGIASSSKEPTFLLTGDLAFYHDLTGLHNSIRFNIPLTIILINNGGGGIFQSLPISRFGEIFRTNFITPLKLDFKKIVKAFMGIYYIASESKKLKTTLKQSVKNKKLNVIEIKTNAKLSSQYRSRFWQIATKKVEKYINDHQS
ncbi:MAG: 2-succinyl-5-enolpyruvyl-6-hydroxy-3-cyclohexene-1-carboxylic-acid synthase [Ignavibacteria bacterium]|nr:2-succinyl-5-enolpyruvyl-6-hydroxy-3-cyclohexene-1-carboxylic-acid synthase [Ignavibacteria bacterium]